MSLLGPRPVDSQTAEALARRARELGLDVAVADVGCVLVTNENGAKRLVFVGDELVDGTPVVFVYVWRPGVYVPLEDPTCSDGSSLFPVPTYVGSLEELEAYATLELVRELMPAAVYVEPREGDPRTILEAWRRPLPGRRALPPELPTRAAITLLGTHPAPATLVQLTADARDARSKRFEHDPLSRVTRYEGHNGHVAMYHHSGLTFGYEAWPDEGQRVAAMIDAIHAQGLSRDAGLRALYCLERLITSDEPAVHISVSELLDLEGLGDRGAAERQTYARQVDRELRAIATWRFEGRTAARDRRNGRVECRIYDTLFHYEEPAELQPTLGMGPGVIDHFRLRSSSGTDALRRFRPYLPYCGTINALARIPAGQIAGDWARSIGLTVLFGGRMNAAREGSNVTRTRRVLLTTHPPNKSVDEILRGGNPQRARAYFTQALGILRERGVIEAFQEPATAYPRQGWADQWLDEEVPVVIAGPAGQALEAIREAAALHARRRGRPRKRP